MLVNKLIIFTFRLLGTLVLFSLLYFFYLYTYKSQDVKKPLCSNCNVIVIDIDMLRYDALDCSSSYDITPNLCKLADKSVTFENNIIHSDLTIPSFISGITSTYPLSHGVWNELLSVNSEKLTTLPGVLNKKNYKTVLAGHLLGNNQITNIDFSYSADFPVLNSDEFNPDLLVKKMKGREPLFLYLYLDYMHFPYLLYGEEIKNVYGKKAPPGIAKTREEFNKQLSDYLTANYRSVFTAEAISNNSVLFNGKSENKNESILKLFNDSMLDKSLTRENLIDIWKPTKDTYLKNFDLENPDHINYLKGNYLALLRMTDEKLKDLIDNILTGELSANTVVVVKADHGEEFQEHGRITHGNNLYQELIHTPLMIKVPDLKPSEVQNLSEDIDIMPTLLELLGIASPQQVQGRSLVTVMTGGGSINKNYQIAQKGGSDYVAAFRYGDWKLILKDSLPIELYHLSEDPGEMDNLLFTEKEKARELQKIYTEITGKLVKYQPFDRILPLNLDEEKRRRLMEEGYF